MEWVADFLKAHPLVRFEFVLSDARADLIAERIDVAFRGGLSPQNLAGSFFVLLSALYFPQHVYDSGRVYTPMLLFLGIQALRGRSILWLAPWLAVVPRIGMQMAPQILGVLRAAAQLK